MLKHIVVILLFVLSFAGVQAQGRVYVVPAYRQPPPPVVVYRPGGPRPGYGGQQQPNLRARIEGIRQNFYNRQLRLSPEESARFWPVYRQYQAELIEVRRQIRANRSDQQPNGSEQVRNEIDLDTKQLEIRKHYNQEFLKILPPEKVSELYKSERQFNDEMLKQLSEREVTGRAQ